jgi:hypothetical protein
MNLILRKKVTDATDGPLRKNSVLKVNVCQFLSDGIYVQALINFFGIFQK